MEEILIIPETTIGVKFKFTYYNPISGLFYYNPDQEEENDD